MIKHGIKHSRSQSLIDFACEYAEKAHKGQKRKYTGEDYIVHPVQVAQIVSTVTDDCECICAAFLHDVIEDCGVTKQQLVDKFGFSIAEMVSQLSDISKPEDGNRAKRKELDRNHTAQAWNKTKTVKLADLLSNTESITKYDPDFAKVYLEEKRLLLTVLIEGDSTLYKKCNDIVVNDSQSYTGKINNTEATQWDSLVG